MSPRYDHYYMKNVTNSDSSAKYGYVYKDQYSILNLWVHSTRWKSVCLSTDLSVDDSVKLTKNDGSILYLKKVSGERINELPFHMYHNDSVNVYQATLKIRDKKWYSKKKDKLRRDTITIELNNKNYEFFLSK
ncbi:hypothetical protein LZQ00_12275 [Sphingobacterium sp. SRCM116780]|uniref:hypothetical protein n=1 Tax=Sphingobacterium sp. SRCM116780 TaxID=2907623 RepID=UPI001F39E245|nr:hypothetical protein [Sphingobacterium sp. SRCM116780]UIR55055.1 hypothetical protein LZQ00_12275 [Sphingobacterium sp. SRCM116780]